MYYYCFYILIGVFTPIQILIEMPTPFNSNGFIIVLIAFLIIEIKTYQMIWGKNACWPIEKCNNAYKKIAQ